MGNLGGFSKKLHKLKWRIWLDFDATTESETVWLRDVTTRFQTDKRTLSDPDLPDHLSFHLKRKSHALTLNLKRNHRIDPNADFYIVRKLRDGQSLLEKTRNLEKEDVAYYQDRENGVFMIAQRVKISNGQCGILINGNVRIGDRSYDLRPSETDLTSIQILETTGLLDKRYVLQEQDETNVHEKSVEEQFTDLLKRIPHEQDKQKQFLRPDVELSTRNAASLHNKGATGNNRSETDNKYDTIRNLKKEYYVEVLVLVDSSVYDLFVTMLKTTVVSKIQKKANKYIRKWYSHIINGVDLLYKEIEDPNIGINVNIRAFVVFQAHFGHTESRLEIFNGTKMIDAQAYLNDLYRWDINSPSIVQLPQYDQAILFTSLGALHDGDMNATACKSDDHFIMSPQTPTFDPTKKYSRNPWLFSKCSVESFKNALKNKTCLISKGNYSDGELSEWKKFMSKLPGQVYDPDKQCHIINGHGSIYCGIFPGDGLSRRCITEPEQMH